jgi:hypothetical protein
MSNSKFLIRLKLIYESLKKSPCDILKLQDVLQKNNLSVNIRQIYRDVKSVENFFLNESEIMEEAEINEKKRAWKINNKKGKRDFSVDEFYSKLILHNSIPSYIKVECKEVLKNDILKGISFKSNHIFFKSIEAINSFIKTGFFEKYYCIDTEKRFNDIFWCIINKRKIFIKSKNQKIYCQNLESFEFAFYPLTFIIHNGSILVAGTNQKNRVLIFDLSELNEYNYMNTKFNKSDQLLMIVVNELEKRFGICENIDNNIYDISIELSKEIGDYLKKFNWHHSQKFNITKTGYILELNCGINRELLGWISALNTKAKIIKPERVKMIFYQNLINTEKLYTSDNIID